MFGSGLPTHKRYQIASWVFVGVLGCGDGAVRDQDPELGGIELAAATGGGNIPTLDLDIRRSLVVTEQPILERFSLERVLTQLATQASTPEVPAPTGGPSHPNAPQPTVSQVTALSLFQQWWDTQNTGPGLGLGAHCDDVIDPTYGPAINGYPYTCRQAPGEGAEATCDPFAADSPCAYIPIALFNRFDLAPRNGAHCGEHRIVYARASGKTDGRARNLIIFEAALPNPHPTQGLKGCRQVADFWADLSDESDLEARADALEEFYFDGLAQIAPVVHFDHYGNQSGGHGQIRTNQFMQPSGFPGAVWSLREFKLIKSCAAGTCDLDMVPVTNKGNPFGPLFDAASTHPNAAAFQAYFPSQVASLAGASTSDIGMDVPDTFNTAQSQASGPENNYVTQFGTGLSSFRTAIDNALLSAGSTLSADNIVARATAQSCAGCHRLSNNAALGGDLSWPPSLGFTHVSERDVDLEVVDGVTRFKLSLALENVFLPHRKLVLEDYILNPPLNSQSSRSIGGRTTH